MDEPSTSQNKKSTPRFGVLPNGLSGDSTILIATNGDPSKFTVCLYVLGQLAGQEDTATVVTTTESADQIVSFYDDLEPRLNSPSIDIIDTISKQQSLSARYSETRVVFIPAPSDVARLLMGFSELAHNSGSTEGAHHLVVRSLTPIIEVSSVAQVTSFIEQMAQYRSESGVSLLGIDYTAHDEETTEAISKLADGVLWVSQSSPDEFAFEYWSSRKINNRTYPEEDTNE